MLVEIFGYTSLVFDVDRRKSFLSRVCSTDTDCLLSISHLLCVSFPSHHLLSISPSPLCLSYLTGEDDSQHHQKRRFASSLEKMNRAGGASGIGLETARVLALRGAHVIIAARNMEAANEAKLLILKDNETARADVLKLDLGSMTSIRAFVDNFNALDLPLNILINNAGVMFCPFQLSEDGIEMQFATNHLGHFVLTNLLLEKMKDTARATGIDGRIVNLSSVAHLHTYEEGIQFDKINDPNSYSDKKAYGQSKLANILHANELSRRLKEEGANITVNSVHPGLIMTNLMRHSALLMRIMKLLTFLLWKNVPQGAATTCYVALHPKVKGVTGKYFLDCNEYTPSDFARNEELAKKLWDYSDKLVNSSQTT